MSAGERAVDDRATLRELYAKYGLDADGIAGTVRETLREAG